MARGFAATSGVGATDNVLATYTTALPTTHSIAAWGFANTTGANNAGRLFSQGVTDGTPVVLQFNASATQMFIAEQWNTTAGFWTFTGPSTGAWHHYAYTYDGGSTSNKPVVYVDGVSVSVTTTQTPAGSYIGQAAPFRIGNRNGADRAWDGLLSWVTAWGAILTAGEMAAIAAGVLPYRIRPSSVVMCYPLWGFASPEIDLIAANGTGVVTGTAKQNDPPVTLFTPKAPSLSIFSAAVVTDNPVPGGRSNPIWGYI